MGASGGEGTVVGRRIWSGGCFAGAAGAYESEEAASNRREWRKNANRWTRGDWNYSNGSNDNLKTPRPSARGGSLEHHRTSNST
ncbi:MAG: hypothetical protein LBD58_08770 [Treponema sp.]|nr:hypothetical protein [Treponema sp.]